MVAFPPSDPPKDLKNLDLSADPLPVQRSLGLSWNLEMDCFTFRVSQEEKPVTKEEYFQQLTAFLTLSASWH